jgi:hypothetical protein
MNELHSMRLRLLAVMSMVAARKAYSKGAKLRPGNRRHYWFDLGDEICVEGCKRQARAERLEK